MGNIPQKSSLLSYDSNNLEALDSFGKNLSSDESSDENYLDPQLKKYIPTSSFLGSSADIEYDIRHANEDGLVSNDTLPLSTRLGFPPKSYDYRTFRV